jgi:hypothetical protein
MKTASGERDVGWLVYVGWLGRLVDRGPDDGGNRSSHCGDRQ